MKRRIRLEPSCVSFGETNRSLGIHTNWFGPGTAQLPSARSLQPRIQPPCFRRESCYLFYEYDDAHGGIAWEGVSIFELAVVWRGTLVFGGVLDPGLLDLRARAPPP